MNNMYAREYNEKPILPELAKHAASITSRRKNTVYICESELFINEPSLGYVLAEILGQDISIKYENRRICFDKLPCTIVINTVPFERRISFFDSDIQHGVNSLVSHIYNSQNPSGLVDSFLPFLNFLENKKINYQIQKVHKDFFLNIDAPSTIIANTEFRELVTYLSQEEFLSQISINPSFNTSVKEINKILKDFNFSIENAQISKDTRSFSVGLSVEEAMNPLLRTQREKLYSIVKLLTGFSHEAQVLSPDNNLATDCTNFVVSQRLVNTGVTFSEVNSFDVPYTGLPNSVSRMMYPVETQTSVYLKGRKVSKSNFIDFCQTFAIKIGIDAEINQTFSTDKNLRVLIDFQTDQNTEQQIQLILKLQEVIDFVGLNVELHPKYSSRMLSHIFSGLHFKENFWISNNKGDIYFLSKSADLDYSKTHDSHKLPQLDIKKSCVDLVIGEDKKAISNFLAQDYAKELEIHLQTRFGIGRTEFGGSGVLVHLPRLINDYQIFLDFIVESLSTYPFPIAIVFDEQLEIKNYSKEQIFALFDALNPKLIPVNVEIRNSGRECYIELYSSNRSFQYDPSVIDILSILLCKKINIDYRTHTIFSQTEGMDPYLVRKIFGLTSRVGILEQDSSLNEYSTKLATIQKPNPNNRFTPCGKVFTYDSGFLYDSAVAISKKSPYETQMQLFPVNVASLVLPGSYAERIAVSRGEAIYTQNSSQWMNLLSDEILKKISLKAGGVYNCFVFDITIIKHSDENIEIINNGISIAEIPVTANIFYQGNIPQNINKDYLLYSEACQDLQTYRRNHGAIIVNDEEFMLEAPTIMINHIAALVAKAEKIPMIYRDASELFRKQGVSNIILKLDQINSYSSSTNRPYPWNLIDNLCSTSSLEEVAAVVEKISQKLLESGDISSTREILRKIVGKNTNTTNPTFRPIGSGVDITARVVPALRNSTAIINQSQLYGHYLGGDVRSTNELDAIIAKRNDNLSRLNLIIENILT